MRKVFLDDLPKFISGTNKGKINWKESIGYKVKFIYDDISDEVEVIDYHKEDPNSFICINYNDNVLLISSSNLLNCRLGSLLGKHLKKHKYNIGDIIETKSGKIQILDQIKMTSRNRKGYKYKCLIDNNISCILESNLYKGQGCSICSGQKVLKGYNDLWTTHPEVCQLMKYPEKGYELSRGSDSLEVFICPNCGYEKSYRISDVVNKRFSCPKCGDGLSYPNKIAFNLLEQINVIFISEYSPDWIKPKRYDFYFEIDNKKYILEMDGGWHTKDNMLSGQSKEKSKEIDNYKDKLAIENEIQVIRINCEYSNIDFIKNNILNSELINIVDLSRVDWLKCHEFALSNLVKTVCDCWSNGIKNTNDIAKITRLHITTVRRYLKKGSIIGWCNYNPKEEKIKNYKNNCVEIIQLTQNGEFLKEWDSIIKASNELKISNVGICSVVKGKNKTSGGFKWMYKEDYEKYIKDKNNNINE